jgi:protein O-mannosyl-transferase
VESDPPGGARATSLDSLTRRTPPLLVAALTVALFAPALGYDFIFWDDDRNFLTNPHYRGLGWAQIRWAFTSVLMGHWIPVTWLTFGLDHAVWGMNAFGYHLTNVLLHAANAVLVYVVALALLRHARPAARPGAVTLGAVVAALFFALHPLRVESVAWVTERRDVLSTCFYLLTVLAYLKACAAAGASRRRWLAASIGAYALGLLSKSLIMSLPLALLVLDVYPLRRASGRWRSVLIEKLPYLVLAVVAAVISVSAVATLGLTSTDAYPPLARAGMALYSLTFYLWKTLLPVGLSPMYELPAHVDLTSPRFLASALVAVGLTAGLLLARRRWPAALAVWLVYGLTLAPVSGIVHNGPQLVADRYSYLACLGLAMLLGAAVASVAESPQVGNPARMALVLASVAWLLVLAVLTREQLPIWRAADEIWTRSLAVDPDCAFCHGQLGALLGNRGEIDLAITHFERVVALRPNRPRHRGNLGLALLKARRPAEAAVQLRLALTEEPTDAETRNRLGLALAEQGKLADASREFGRAVADNPRHTGALTNLGLALIDLGRPAEAVPYLERAVALDPAALPRDLLVRARGVTGVRPRRRAGTARAKLRREAMRGSPPRPPVVPPR